MSDISTASSNVIPFDFRGHSVRAVSIGGEPWFVATDACKVLGLTNTTTALLALDEDERSKFSLGRQGEVNIVNESGLYTLILRCRDAVTKGSKPHAFRRWVTSEVLPSIRKTGTYSDTRNTMATLVGDVIGSTGEVVLNRVIEQKGYRIAPALQRSYKHTMKSRLRSRFNVQKASLIPADQMADACNFIVSYALEGEFLPKQDLGSLQLTDKQAMDLSHLLHSVAWFGHRWNQGICQGLQYLNRDLYQGTVEHVDSMRRSAGSLDDSLKDLLQEIDLRYKLGGRRPDLGVERSAA